MIYYQDIPYSAAYGYATKEQVVKMNELKCGINYKQIKKQIEFQTKHKGKVKGLSCV